MLTLSFRMVVRTKDRAFLSDPSERPLGFVIHANNPSVFLKHRSSGRARLEGVKNNNNRKECSRHSRNSRNGAILFELLAAISKVCANRVFAYCARNVYFIVINIAYFAWRYRRKVTVRRERRIRFNSVM